MTAQLWSSVSKNTELCRALWFRIERLQQLQRQRTCTNANCTLQPWRQERDAKGKADIFTDAVSHSDDAQLQNVPLVSLMPTVVTTIISHTFRPFCHQLVLIVTETV